MGVSPQVGQAASLEARVSAATSASYASLAARVSAAVDAADFANGDAVVEYLTHEARQWYAGEETAADVVKELDVAKRLQTLAKAIKSAQAGTSKYRIVPMEIHALQEAMNEVRMAITDVLKEERDAADAETAAETRAPKSKKLAA